MLNLFTIRIYGGADRTYLNSILQIQNNLEVTLEQYLILTNTQESSLMSIHCICALISMVTVMHKQCVLFQTIY